MKNKFKENRVLFRKIMAVLMAFVLISLCSCGIDPNVKQNENKTTKYQIATTKSSENIDENEFNAYGDGLCDAVTVKGVKVDVNAFALRSYELAFLIGTNSFKKAQKISVDALTQYAFAHLFYKDLYKISNSGAVYKEATNKKLQDELKKHFGKMKVDLKKSSLYNKGNKRFEMWLPEYGSNVYYRIDAADVSGDKVVIKTLFFNEMKKSTKLGKTQITVKIKNKKPIISSLKKG